MPHISCLLSTDTPNVAAGNQHLPTLCVAMLLNRGGGGGQKECTGIVTLKIYLNSLIFFSKVILIVMFVNLKMIVFHSGVKIPGSCVLKKEHGEEYKAII